MVLKNAIAAALCTGLLMSGSAALADEYRAGEFLGLDLSKAVLSPKRLGPETEFAPVPDRGENRSQAGENGTRGCVEGSRAHSRKWRRRVHSSANLVTGTDEIVRPIPYILTVSSTLSRFQEASDGPEKRYCDSTLHRAPDVGQRRAGRRVSRRRVPRPRSFPRPCSRRSGSARRRNSLQSGSRPEPIASR